MFKWTVNDDGHIRGELKKKYIDDIIDKETLEYSEFNYKNEYFCPLAAVCLAKEKTLVDGVDFIRASETLGMLNYDDSFIIADSADTYLHEEDRNRSFQSVRRTLLKSVGLNVDKYL